VPLVALCVCDQHCRLFGAVLEEPLHLVLVVLVPDQDGDQVIGCIESSDHHEDEESLVLLEQKNKEGKDQDHIGNFGARVQPFDRVPPLWEGVKVVEKLLGFFHRVLVRDHCIMS
jgi:hypothetical protein